LTAVRTNAGTIYHRVKTKSEMQTGRTPRQVKAMITCGMNTSTIREQLLQKNKLTLDKAIEQYLIEMARKRSNQMEKTATTFDNSIDIIYYSKKKGQQDELKMGNSGELEIN